MPVWAVLVAMALVVLLVAWLSDRRDGRGRHRPSRAMSADLAGRRRDVAWQLKVRKDFPRRSGRPGFGE